MERLGLGSYRKLDSKLHSKGYSIATVQSIIGQGFSLKGGPGWITKLWKDLDQQVKIYLLETFWLNPE